MSRDIAAPHIIAHFQAENGFPAWITYYPVPHLFRDDQPRITLFYGTNRCRPQGPCLRPAEMLEWTPHIFHEKPIDGKRWEPGSPDWFRHKCAEAGCSWFVSFVERMAAGEDIPIEEIKAAYREHNGGKELEQRPICELK